MQVYFDNAATTVVYPEVRELSIRLMSEDYGNPSSMHHKGVIAEDYVTDAAKKIAKTFLTTNIVLVRLPPNGI